MLFVPRTAFSQWLEQKYLDWQMKQGKRAPVTAFAEFLELPNTTVVNWLSGTRKPTPDHCDVLAYKLNDLGCYELLGYPTPDPVLLRVKMEWDFLTDEQREAIGRVLAEGDEPARGSRRKRVSAGQ